MKVKVFILVLIVVITISKINCEKKSSERIRKENENLLELIKKKLNRTNSEKSTLENKMVDLNTNSNSIEREVKTGNEVEYMNNKFEGSISKTRNRKMYLKSLHKRQIAEDTMTIDNQIQAFTQEPDFVQTSIPESTEVSQSSTTQSEPTTKSTDPIITLKYEEQNEKTDLATQSELTISNKITTTTRIMEITDLNLNLESTTLLIDSSSTLQTIKNDFLQDTVEYKQIVTSESIKNDQDLTTNLESTSTTPIQSPSLNNENAEVTTLKDSETTIEIVSKLVQNEEIASTQSILNQELESSTLELRPSTETLKETLNNKIELITLSTILKEINYDTSISTRGDSTLNVEINTSSDMETILPSTTRLLENTNDITFSDSYQTSKKEDLVYLTSETSSIKLNNEIFESSTNKIEELTSKPSEIDLDSTKTSNLIQMKLTDSTVVDEINPTILSTLNTKEISTNETILENQFQTTESIKLSSLLTEKESKELSTEQTTFNLQNSLPIQTEMNLDINSSLKDDKVSFSEDSTLGETTKSYIQENVASTTNILFDNVNNQYSTIINILNTQEITETSNLEKETTKEGFSSLSIGQEESTIDKEDIQFETTSTRALNSLNPLQNQYFTNELQKETSYVTKNQVFGNETEYYSGRQIARSTLEQEETTEQTDNTEENTNKENTEGETGNPGTTAKIIENTKEETDLQNRFSTTTTSNDLQNNYINQPTSEQVDTQIQSTTTISDSLKESFTKEDFNSPTFTTRNNNQPIYANNSDCVFPFIYKNVTYKTCITIDRIEPWCSTTSNYDLDLSWKFCRDVRVSTTGGNSNGAKCHFPFKYQNKMYYSCIEKEYQTNDGEITYTKFCSTTSDYDRDKKWGFCMDYSECHFPFFYNNNLYTNCITSYLSPSFCSTTFNFNQDKKWISCPVVCSGFPEKGQKVLSFRYINHRQPCFLKQHYHKLNGYKIREYVTPPCQLEYSCEPGYTKLYDEIECRLDGSYDKKAFCVPENLYKKIFRSSNLV